jgi:hypothetical protein
MAGKMLTEKSVTAFFADAGYRNVSIEIVHTSHKGSHNGTKIKFGLDSGERGMMHLNTFPDVDDSRRWLIRSAVTQARRSGRTKTVDPT